MPTRTERRDAHRFWETLALLPVFLLLCVPAAADENVAPAPRTGLTFTGRAGFADLGPLGEQKFRLDLRVVNPLDEPVAVRRAEVLLCHAGGWLEPLEGAGGEGSFFRGAHTLAAGEARVVSAQAFVARTPATHAILHVDADDGPGQLTVPIQREDFEAPAACRPVRPFGVGVVGPLEALTFSDGKTAVLLIGQHQVLAGPAPAQLVTTVSVGSDKGSTEPLTWEGLDAKGDRRALWPFARRITAFDGFEGGHLRLSTRGVVAGEPVSFRATWPVARVEPVALRAPVLGRWQLSNGPGQEAVHDHYLRPQHRYAYDMVVVRQGRTHTGDPHDNASYFAWNRSVRAVADGTIVNVCDSERDNPGYRGALTTCHDNRVVIRHPDGLFSAYLHLRRNSIAKGLQKGSRVQAGQVIARVGNSGDSSEPHLHFMAFRIDASGRLRSVPVTFSNAWHDARATRSVQGVALGGAELYFRNVR